jgi:hypothetical protein
MMKPAGMLLITVVTLGLGTAGVEAQHPTTPDGVPDLQGVWDYRTLTPLERPAAFADRAFMTPEEAADYERRAAERTDGRPPDDPRRDPSVHPPDWLDYGKTLQRDLRTSLIIDPPDGRIPALTPAAVARQAERRQGARGRGSADNPEDRSLFERCITRGLPDSLLPAGYNNNLQIVQTPGYVLLYIEMIHEARIVPTDGRAHLPGSVTQWMGDSVGRWEGRTLVVETTNFSDRISFRGATPRMRLIERFTRLDQDTLEYRATVEDPETWVRPWTVSLGMARSDERMFEYACHEGNHGLANILSQARTLERSPSR